MRQDNFQQQPDEKRILSTLLRYCNSQERSRKEVVEKLTKLGVSKEEQPGYIDRLTGQNLLNEGRYVEMFVRGHLRLNWGKSKIAYVLRMKGIDKGLIEKSFLSIVPAAYKEQIAVLAHKKWDSMSSKTNVERARRTMDFLARKGFERNMVLEVVQKLRNKHG